MNSSGSGVRSSEKQKLATPNSLLQTQHGFSYVSLIVAITIIGISIGAAGKYWSNVILRDKEEELLFRGDQYRIAIERYYFAIHGRPQYPSNIEDLLKDNRTPLGRRHLRQQYKDPISGEDFVMLRDQLSKRIIGVHSPSDKPPLKKANFREEYKAFEGKEKYSEWLFLTSIQSGKPPAAPKPPAPAGLR